MAVDAVTCRCPTLVDWAIGGGKETSKGYDLLPPELGELIHYTGHSHDDVSLRLLYSAADVMVIPSLQDNLPNTGKEALACGTLVVAFDTCGLPDIVDHEVAGYLVKTFDSSDLAQGIKWVLEDKKRRITMGNNARRKAIEKFAYEVVARNYMGLYGNLI